MDEVRKHLHLSSKWNLPPAVYIFVDIVSSYGLYLLADIVSSLQTTDTYSLWEPSKYSFDQWKSKRVQSFDKSRMNLIKLRIFCCKRTFLSHYQFSFVFYLSFSGNLKVRKKCEKWFWEISFVKLSMKLLQY